MPSDVLLARATYDTTTVELVFNQRLGDHPITDSDGTSVYEWVVSTQLHYALEQLQTIGINHVSVIANRLSFSFLEGLEVLELIAQVMKVVAKFHEKVPFVVLKDRS